jgi:hypothetical protein
MSPSSSTTVATMMALGWRSAMRGQRTAAGSRVSWRPGRRAADTPLLAEPLHEVRVVRGCVAIVALALGAYCLMAAATARETPSASADRDNQELVSAHRR